MRKTGLSKKIKTLGSYFVKKTGFLRKNDVFFHQNCRNRCDFNFGHGFKKTVNFQICHWKSAFWKTLWGLSKSWFSIVFRIFNSFFETTSFISLVFLKPLEVSTNFFFLGKMLKIFKKIVVSWPIFGRNLAKMRVSQKLTQH